MTCTLAFDIYGTLFDTCGLVGELEQYAGQDAGRFAETWRNKQLEYSYRRGLMRDYVDFSVCTSNALDFAAASHGLELTQAQKQNLLAVYDSLPAFDDVEDSLTALKNANHSLYAFSNGSARAVNALLATAGIREYFTDIVSVEELQTFKPDPDVYAHFLSRTGATGTDAWLISSNSFDVIGAASAGMKAAWLRRSATAILDPWGSSRPLPCKACPSCAGISGAKMPPGKKI